MPFYQTQTPYQIYFSLLSRTLSGRFSPHARIPWTHSHVFSPPPYYYFQLVPFLHQPQISNLHSYPPCVYSLTLNIFIHNSFGLICIIRAVEAGCLLSRETLDLMPVVLARIRGVLVADGPPLEDTLTEMLRRLVLILERVKELAESVVATKFKQLYFL